MPDPAPPSKGIDPARIFGRLVGFGVFLLVAHMARHRDCWTSDEPPQHCRGVAFAPQPPPMPASFGLDTDDAERVRAVIDAEMAPLLHNPAFRDRARETAASVHTSGDATAAGYDLGATVVAAGIRRLPTAELIEWNRLRGEMARSDALCVEFWTGNVVQQDIGRALAALSDADLHAWARLSAHAGILEVEADPSAATTTTDEDDLALGEGINFITDHLRGPEGAAFDATIHAGESAAPTEACSAMRMMLSGADSMPARMRERYLRSLAAL